MVVEAVIGLGQPLLSVEHDLLTMLVVRLSDRLQLVPLRRKGERFKTIGWVVSHISSHARSVEVDPLRMGRSLQQGKKRVLLGCKDEQYSFFALLQGKKRV